jgi:hypothetical protein
VAAPGRAAAGPELANDLTLDQGSGDAPGMRGRPGRIAVPVDENVGRSTTSLQASGVEPGGSGAGMAATREAR